MKEQKSGKWAVAIAVVIMLFIVSLITAGILGLLFFDGAGFGNVALIQVKGTIMADRYGGFFSDETASSTDIVDFIKEANDDSSIKAIIIEINSPGGSAVATDEIASAIKKTNKTTVAWIREIGASGGYWIASSADHIVANRMSITGSIGVIGSYLEFYGLMNRYNVTYQRLVAGKYKDIGTPFKEMTEEEEKQIQAILDQMHEVFIQEVAGNRNLDEDFVRNLSTGMVYLGSDAKKFGLVDELGGKDEVVRYIEKKLNITAEIATYEKERTFMEILGGIFSQKDISLESSGMVPQV